MTCAWCGKGDLPGAVDSHGICPECEERELEKIEADYGPEFRHELEERRKAA